VAEGDTIHRLARRLRAALIEPVERASAPAADSPLRRQSRRLDRLTGSRMTAAEARGKHLLLSFDAGLVLHSHLGMGGAWHVRDPGERWRRAEGSAKVVLETSAHDAAQFGGTLALLTPVEARSDPRLRRLGPDVLGDGKVDRLVESLRRADPARGLGDALVDQRLIAGIGNIFKSEGCFAARIDPWRRLGELDDESLAAVVGSIRNLMLAALESGRGTRAVHRRTGRPCTRCAATIRARGQGDGNRMTYWCPGCQR
jgi:endonuclease VIII